MIVKLHAMTFQDAQQFNNVPARASNAYEIVADGNPNTPRDWRFGDYVQRENIPSMIIGQEGFGRSRKVPKQGKDILDRIIAREERQMRRARDSVIIRTTSIPVKIPDLNGPQALPRVSRNGSHMYWCWA